MVCRFEDHVHGTLFLLVPGPDGKPDLAACKLIPRWQRNHGEGFYQKQTMLDPGHH